MKLSYLVPIYDTKSITPFIKGIVDSDFFAKNECAEMILCLKKDDKLDDEALKILSNINVVMLKADKDFSFNDAFYASIEHVSGDALLLVDTHLKNTPALITKCLKKHENGARIVFVKKKREKTKGFFYNIFEKVYNLFISIYTGKRDKGNIISMGLIDKYVVDLLKSIPHRRCALKNTDNLYKVKTSTIYVNPNMPCEKTNIKVKTSSKTATIVSGIAGVALIALAIIINIFTHLFLLNTITIFVAILCIITSLLALPKHIYDCRNKNINNVKFDIEPNNVNSTK